MTESTSASAPMRIAAIGDTHIKDDQPVPIHEIFAEACQQADVLVLAGDLTDHGRISEAEILAEELRACTIPVIGVLGNHDYESGHGQEIKEVLRRSGMHVLDGDTYEYNGVGFVGVKGFAGGFGRWMLGAFGEQAIKAFVNESVNESLHLENAMHTMTTERIVVVLHYSPVSGTLEGEPREIWPFLGSSRLGETIDRFNVSAVIHGHVHHGTYQANTLAGTPVYNVAMPVIKPNDKAYGIITI